MMAVGVDLGVTRFATLSDGTVFAPLHIFRAMEEQLAWEHLKGGAHLARLFFGRAEESGATPIELPFGGVDRKESSDFK
jgi:hypothetical protein